MRSRCDFSRAVPALALSLILALVSTVEATGATVCTGDCERGRRGARLRPRPRHVRPERLSGGRVRVLRGLYSHCHGRAQPRRRGACAGADRGRVRVARNGLPRNGWRVSVDGTLRIVRSCLGRTPPSSITPSTSTPRQPTLTPDVEINSDWPARSTLRDRAAGDQFSAVVPDLLLTDLRETDGSRSVTVDGQLQSTSAGHGEYKPSSHSACCKVLCARYPVS